MKNLDESNLSEVENLTCIIDFWAPWCRPCVAMKGVLEDINEDEVKIFKVNVDEQENIASKFGIQSIPTLIFINKGAEVERLVGSKTKETILEVFKKISGGGDV